MTGLFTILVGVAGTGHGIVAKLRTASEVLFQVVSGVIKGWPVIITL